MKPGEIYKASVVLSPMITGQPLACCDLTLVDGKPTLVLKWMENRDTGARIPTITFSVEPSKLTKLPQPNFQGATYAIEGVLHLSPDVVADLRS